MDIIASRHAKQFSEVRQTPEEVHRTRARTLGCPRLNEFVPDLKSLNIPTMGAPWTNDVMEVSNQMVWVQIPCAVDGGACAYVAPANMFGVLSPSTKLGPKYSAAAG